LKAQVGEKTVWRKYAFPKLERGRTIGPVQKREGRGQNLRHKATTQVKARGKKKRTSSDPGANDPSHVEACRVRRGGGTKKTPTENS